MKYEFIDLIDVDKNQKLLDSFCDAIGVAAAIIDLQGDVIIGSRWQRICTEFHRVNERTRARCIESDTKLANELQRGKRFSIYRCKNGLTDAASPIIIGDRHMANVFVGQFLLEQPDTGFFCRQAVDQGFEKKAYLDALKVVPIVDEKRLPVILNFLSTFAESLATTALDRLAQLEAERSLRKNEEKYRTLIEATSEGYWLLDRERKTLELNQSLCNMLGYTPGEMIGRTPLDFVDGENREILKRQMAAIEDTLHRSYEITLKRKTGEDVATLFNATTIFDDSGTVRSSFALITDITERKRAEEALRTSEAQLSNAMKIAQLGHWEYDVAKDLFIFNDHFYSIFRTSAEKVGGYQMSSARYAQLFVHPDDISVVGEEIRKALETTDSHYARQLEHRTIYGNGETGYIAVRFFIVKDAQGRTVKTFGANQDITARRLAEEEKKRLETQLRQAQKMEAIGTLAGGIAHDFNNILTPIIIHSELAQLTMAKDHSAQSSLEEVLKAAHRARDLVRQILAFSRRSEQQRMPIDIVPVVKEGIKLLRSSIPKTIAFQQNIKADSATIEGDPTQIHQILMNLCANAAHAMRESGGVLDISLEKVDVDHEAGTENMDVRAGRYVRLAVSDTGQGMDRFTLSRAFDPFFTTKGRSEGTGMGLAVVHGIVKSYGGAIRTDSVIGRGTTFEIFLPRTKMKASREAEKPSGLPVGTERVLLVDDEKPMVDAVRMMLDRLGYKVVASTSSIEALDAFRVDPQRFDLVITDMTMPNMTGRELANEIMTIRPDIPIVLCTGFSEQIDEDTAKTMGIREFVMKPIVMKEMAETIRRVLGQEPRPELHG